MMRAQSNLSSPPTLAVLGAGGFAGARLVELAAMAGRFRLIPVLRTYRGMARLGGMIERVSVTDTGNAEALGTVLRGCQTVVNLTLGDPLKIVSETQVLYEACRRAGVKQFIHTSSTAVFGRVAQPSIHDDSPPDTRSWMLYAREKAKAEVWLAQQGTDSQLKVVVVRPGLIWGPGASWSMMVGDQLQHGRAILSNRGEGIANLVFVDNLARILLAIAAHPEGPGGSYNVADAETVTWKEYYAGLATRLRYPSGAVLLLEDVGLGFGPRRLVEWALEQAPLFWMAMRCFKRLGPGPKAAIKSRLKGYPMPPDLRIFPGRPPAFSHGIWELHHTVRRLPSQKLQRDFGPVDLIPFTAALDRTASWLDFAGFGAPTQPTG